MHRDRVNERELIALHTSTFPLEYCFPHLFRVFFLVLFIRGAALSGMITASSGAL